MTIIFDISTVAPRFGVPGGVGRVETEFAAYAYHARPDVQFSVFDKSRETFWKVRRDWVPALVGTQAMLDMSYPSSAQEGEGPRWGKVSVAFRRSIRFDHHLQVALERVRLTSGSPLARRVAEKGVAVVSHARALRKRSKFRPTIVPFDLGIEGPLELDADCVVVSAGGHLGYRRPDRMAELKAARGFRYVVLCHDLILIQFPELIGAANSEIVRRHWITTFPMSDLLVFTTRTVERDVRAFCADHGIALGQTSVVGLGWDPQSFEGDAGALPPSVKAGKYVLQVSSLDARKGHDLMLRVWKRLLAEGVPQSHDFKLVFVGNYGTNTPHLKKSLANGEMGPTVVHFRSVVDERLATFYRNAAFCVFPSRYEGYGLPAVEALGMGKPLIASTGGAIPEVVGGVAPCIDPDDEEAWYRQIKTWIVEPAERLRAEERVRREFRYPTWRQSGEAFFAAIDRTPASARSTLTIEA